MTQTQLLREEVKHLHDCVEELKRDVKANGEAMEKVRVILESFAVVGAIARWVGYLAVAVAAVIGAVKAIKGG